MGKILLLEITMFFLSVLLGIVNVAFTTSLWLKYGSKDFYSGIFFVVLLTFLMACWLLYCKQKMKTKDDRLLWVFFLPSMLYFTIRTTILMVMSIKKYGFFVSAARFYMQQAALIANLLIIFIVSVSMIISACKD